MLIASIVSFLTNEHQNNIVYIQPVQTLASALSSQNPSLKQDNRSLINIKEYNILKMYFKMLTLYCANVRFSLAALSPLGNIVCYASSHLND